MNTAQTTPAAPPPVVRTQGGGTVRFYLQSFTGFMFKTTLAVKRKPSIESTERNLLETVARCMKEVTDSVFPIVEDVHGFMCEIFFPIENPSIYGYTTDKIVYADEPTLIRRCAIAGLIVDRIDSGDALDNYFGPQPIVWIHGDVVVPHHSKLRVLVRDYKYLTFLVDNEVSVYGMDDAMIRKLAVLPLAAR